MSSDTNAESNNRAKKYASMREFYQSRGLCPDWREYEAFVLSTLAITPDEVVALVEDTEAMTA